MLEPCSQELVQNWRGLQRQSVSTLPVMTSNWHWVYIYIPWQKESENHFRHVHLFFYFSYSHICLQIGKQMFSKALLHNSCEKRQCIVYLGEGRWWCDGVCVITHLLIIKVGWILSSYISVHMTSVLIYVWCFISCIEKICSFLTWSIFKNYKQPLLLDATWLFNILPCYKSNTSLGK